MRENKPMKLLSVAIPCYNSAAYMRNCIESLLPGGDEVEILIVDDGSTKDNTAEIADEYERNYPGICRAIHQETVVTARPSMRDCAMRRASIIRSWTAMTGSTKRRIWRFWIRCANLSMTM